MELTRFGSRGDVAATALRLALALMYLSHAYFKLGMLGMAATVQFFESLGLPGWTAYATVTAELAGGMLLIAGVASGRTAIALTPILAGALWVHWGNGWVFSAPGGGWEFPAYLIALSVLQAVLGNGGWALRPRAAQAAAFPLVWEKA